MFKRRPRLQKFGYVGRQRYFLTFCTHERARVFERDAIVDRVRQQIMRTAGEEGFEISAYVFMPDHLHLLVRGLDGQADLRRFVRRAKQHSGYLVARQAGERLWQPSYYDHVVRDEEGELPFVRYILENPVRAGLVTHPENYPFLGVAAMAVDQMVAMLESAGIEVWKAPRSGEALQA